MIRKATISLLIVVLSETVSLGEIKDIGTPFIRNFSKQDYMGGTHNWAVAQDQKGFVYFANDEGLLVFDGVQWQLYKMPNMSMVRSIYIDDMGEIYIGAYNDIGTMAPTPDGNIAFRSFRQYLPEEFRNFDDVWNILPFRNRVVFQSYNAAFLLDRDSSITIIKAPSRFQCSYSVSGRLLFNDVENGLFEYDGSNLLPLSGCEKLRGQDIWAILPYRNGGEMLVCTLGNGLFRYDGKVLTDWDVPVNELLKKWQIFSATVLHEKYFAFGTILQGVVITDQNGNVIQQIDRKEGLQNNTILDVFSDRTGNLWLGLDNGIDYLNVNSPVTFLKGPDGFGSGYASVIHKDKLYLGTNQGLYVMDWKDDPQGNEVRMIPGTYGQVWYLGVHRDVLICGHNNGTYAISGDEAVLISKVPGGWKYHILERSPDYMIGGTFSGLELFRWQNGMWNFVTNIGGFSESFRVFEEDEDGDLWMSHVFKGIFRVTLNARLDSVVASRYYTNADGLPSDYNLNVFRIKDRLIFTSDSGIYEYVSHDDRFVYSAYFNRLLSPIKSISYLKEDSDGNIWYISDKKAGVFRIQEDFTFRQVTSPFTLLAGKFINGFESVYVVSGDHVFFGIENGFAHYSPHAYFRSYPEFSTYITKAKANHADSIFYFGRSTARSSAMKRSAFRFPYRENSFTFTYSSPVYDNPGNIEYSYKMSGLDEEWSEWSRSYTREFSNLPDGRYIFIVKARNQLGLESIADSIEINVLPPWYKTLAARIGYALLLLSLVVLLLWSVNRRIEVANRKERLNQLRKYREKEKDYIKQALEAEKEIITMKNERLQLEMIQRDKELANQAMNLVGKNEFLTNIREELHKLKGLSREEGVNDKIISIIARLNREVNNNEQLEVFKTAFDEVHEDFLERLKARYPLLTPTEHRLCAFIKMNLSTKEIAPLMKISVRGVEICRYRLRKKLGIDKHTNLSGLLREI